MEDLKTVLNQIATLTDEEFEVVSKHFSYKEFKKNEFVVGEGDTCKEIVYIIEGAIRSYYSTEKGEVTRFVDTDDSFTAALVSFLSQQPSHEILQAITHCKAYVISYESMNMLYDELPKWQELGRKVMERSYLEAENRVMSFIAETAEERYRNLIARKPKLLELVPLQYIASMIGVQPETLSRIRKRF